MRALQQKSFTGPLILLTVICFLIVGLLPFAPSPFGDVNFHQEAKTLSLALRGSSAWSDLRISHAPGPALYYAIPYLLVPTGASEHTYWLAACIWNFLCTTLATLLIYFAARRLAGERTGRIAAILVLIAPFGIYYSFGIAAETPGFLGAAAFAYGWARYRTHQANGALISCSGLILLVLNRPNTLPVAALAVLIAALGWTSKSAIMRAEARLAFLCALFTFGAVVIASVLLAQQTGNEGLRVQTTNIYDILLQGSFQFRTEPWDWRNWGKNTRAGSQDYQNWSEQRDKLLQRSLDSGIHFRDVERAWVVDDFLTHPLLHVRMTAVRVLSQNIATVNSVHPESFGIGPFRGRWVFFVFHGLLNLIGLMPLAGSLWFVTQRRREILTYWPLWSPWLALFTFHALVYAEPRYLLPSRPLLCIMSALALTQYLKSRQSAASGLSRDGSLVMVGRGWAADGSNGEREVIKTRVKV
jgi:hypothetical protein